VTWLNSTSWPITDLSYRFLNPRAQSRVVKTDFLDPLILFFFFHLFISGFFGSYNSSQMLLLVHLELTNQCTTKNNTHEIIEYT
jgi:hypothetical protein